MEIMSLMSFYFNEDKYNQLLEEKKTGVNRFKS